MPFIDSKISFPITKEQEEAVKTRLGQAVTKIPGKSEDWLMVGFEDDYKLYFKGRASEKVAFVEVKVYGGPNSSAFDALTAEICKIFNEEMGIPADHVYVAYGATQDWGWNGRNF